jgi:uncharacterized damage-inducible protein DinB
MKDYLLDTFRYNDWANRQVLEKILELAEPQEAARLFSHLINSQDKWMARIEENPNEAQLSWFEPIYPLAELADQWQRSLSRWLNFLEQLTEAELEREVAYTAADTKRYSSRLREIALQLNYHSIHHRAQMSLLIRKQGIEPPFIDYIGVTRQEL